MSPTIRSNKASTRASAAPYTIVDTGQTVSSGSGVSPIPQDVQIVPRNLAIQLSTAERRSSSMPPGGFPDGSWTMLQQNNLMEVEHHEHFQENPVFMENHQHDTHLHDNRSVAATFQSIDLNAHVVGAAMEEIAAAHSQTQHANAVAEATVVQAQQHVAHVTLQASNIR